MRSTLPYKYTKYIDKHKIQKRVSFQPPAVLSGEENPHTHKTDRYRHRNRNRTRITDCRRISECERIWRLSEGPASRREVKADVVGSVGGDPQRLAQVHPGPPPSSHHLVRVDCRGFAVVSVGASSDGATGARSRRASICAFRLRSALFASCSACSVLSARRRFEPGSHLSHSRRSVGRPSL